MRREIAQWAKERYYLYKQHTRKKMKKILVGLLITTFSLTSFADCTTSYNQEIQNLKKADYDSKEGKFAFASEHIFDGMNERFAEGGVKNGIINWTMFITNPAWFLPTVVAGKIISAPYAIKRGVYRRQIKRGLELIKQASENEGKLLRKITNKLSKELSKSISEAEVAEVINRANDKKQFCKTSAFTLADIAGFLVDEFQY